jgi:hypothetical protein
MTIKRHGIWKFIDAKKIPFYDWCQYMFFSNFKKCQMWPFFAESTHFSSIFPKHSPKIQNGPLKSIYVDVVWTIFVANFIIDWK